VSDSADVLALLFGPASLLFELLETIYQILEAQYVKAKRGFFIVSAHFPNDAAPKNNSITLADISVVVDISPLLTFEDQAIFRMGCRSFHLPDYFSFEEDSVGATDFPLPVDITHLAAGEDHAIASANVRFLIPMADLLALGDGPIGFM